MQNSILKELKGHTFSKDTVFNRLPILMVEAFFDAFVDNPYYVRAGITRSFAGATFMIETYEDWNDASISMISDKDIISDIVKEGRKRMFEYKPFLDSFLADKKSEYANLELAETIHHLHHDATMVYYENLPLNENILETDDPSLLEELPKVRLEISEQFVTPLWDCYKKVLAEIHENTGVPVSTLENLTSAELVSLLNGDKTVSQRGVKNRPIAFVILNNERHMFTDSDASSIADFLRNQDTRASEIQSSLKTGVLTGKTAHKGKAAGRVVLLREGDYPNAAEILGGKKQYILVTPMTRPEIAMYFSEALAFVTDEGGITCHAAIVAREMNKPCVISTRFATKVLKDGDMVEVDADEGVVRRML